MLQELLIVLVLLFEKYKHTTEHMILKGHWTSVTSSPILFKKVGIFIPKEVLAKVMTASLVLHSSSTYFLRNIAICSNFYFFEVDLKKYTIQWPMGHSGDDVNHKRLNKMKTHWQNRLKFLVLVYKVFFKTRSKKDKCYTCPMPL